MAKKKTKTKSKTSIKRDKRGRGKTYKKSEIVNWPAYNASLVNRGSLTMWITEDALQGWLAVRPVGTAAGPGAPRIFSNAAIETLLMLRIVYGMTLRSVVGFASSIFKLMGSELPMPDYSTLCRRGKELSVDLESTLGRLGPGPIEVALDSTGLKIYGEGEWKVRTHGIAKRRIWRKLHLAIDPKTRLITGVELTQSERADADEAAGLLKASANGGKRKIGKATADGSYDKRKVYQELASHGAEAVIPPRKDAKIWEPKKPGAVPHARDANLRAIRKSGRAKWKRESGYHQRSLAENAVGRYKAKAGPRMRGRKMESQKAEARLGAKMLNKMTNSGMPERRVIA